MATRLAAFLDRDGTLVEDTHFISDPASMHLVSGASAAVARLNVRGILTIVATNQSGIARGILTEAQYRATRHRLDELLAADGAHLDGSYHCPHHEQIDGPCDCRKPRIGMYVQAARDFDIDLPRSLFVGDHRRDVEPALALGGVGMLIPTRDTTTEEVEWATVHALVVPTLGDAVGTFLASLAPSV